MGSENTTKIRIEHNGIVWHNAELDPPKVSGEYLTWSEGGGAQVMPYSAKYRGWGVLMDGRRDYEAKNIEWWTPIIPPTMYE